MFSLRMMRSRKKDLRLLGWAVAGLFFLVLAGCATVQEKPQFPEVVWPEPPETPRVKFIGVIRSRNDVGKTAGELFTEALLGPKKAPQSLGEPVSVLPARDGKRLYVTDYRKAVVFVFDYEARRMWFLGEPPHEFGRPFGIALDEKDNVYVADSIKKLVRVFEPGGKFLRNITDKSLERPTGIAIDTGRRRLYVVDSSRKESENHVVHVFDLDGAYLKAFGGQGGGTGKFFFPTYVSLDGKGNVYVTDTLNARMQVFDPEGNHLKTIGRRGDAGGMFSTPKGVALDTFGNVYVVDSAWSNVQIFNPKGELLLFFGGRGVFPGLLNNPTGIAIDKDNRIYVADTFNNRVAIYQLINTKAEDSFVTLPPLPEKPEKEVDLKRKGGGSTKSEERKDVERTLTKSTTGK